MGRRKKTMDEYKEPTVEEAEVLEEKEKEPEPVEEVTKKITPPKKEVVKDALPLVPLKVYCSLSGKKWDQLAGFKLYASKSELKAMTIPDWHKAFDKFMSSPVK